MDVTQKLFDATVRAETIIHLASMAYEEDSWAEVVREVVSDYGDDEICDLLEISGDLDEQEIQWAVCESGKTGFLIQMATPVPKYHPDSDNDGSYTFSWGHYATKWFYGDDILTIYEDGIKWAEEYRSKQRDRQLAA